MNLADPSLPLLAIAGAFALIAALPAVGLAATRRVVPAATWWIGPCVVVVIGDLVALWRLETVRTTLAGLGDSPMALAVLGHGHGMTPAVLGWWTATAAFLLIGVLAAGTHLLATRGGRWTPARAVVPGLLALGLPAAGLASSALARLDLVAASPALVGSAGCLLLVSAALRDHDEPEPRRRIASLRFALAGCAIGAAILTTQAATVWTDVQVVASTWTIPGSDLVLDPARRARIVGGLGVLGATAASLSVAGPHLRFTLPTRSRAGLFLAGALAAMLFGAELALRSSAGTVMGAEGPPPPIAQDQPMK